MQRYRFVASAVAVGLLLPACSGADGPDLTVEGAAAVVQQPEAAETDEEAAILVHHARSRMSPSRAGVAAVYLDLENPTATDDVLVAASVPEGFAGRVEVHETYEVDDDSMAGDGHMSSDGNGHMSDDTGMHGGSDSDAPAMMGMREVPGIPVPAGSTVELVPGGYHIMLMDLAEDLVTGEEFTLTLELEHAGAVTVSVEVRDHADV